MRSVEERGRIPSIVEEKSGAGARVLRRAGTRWYVLRTCHVRARCTSSASRRFCNCAGAHVYGTAPDRGPRSFGPPPGRRRSAARYLQRRANSSRGLRAPLVTTVFSSWSTSIDLWSIVNARLIERAWVARPCTPPFLCLPPHDRSALFFSLSLFLLPCLPLSCSLLLSLLFTFDDSPRSSCCFVRQRNKVGRACSRQRTPPTLRRTFFEVFESSGANSRVWYGLQDNFSLRLPIRSSFSE